MTLPSFIAGAFFVAIIYFYFKSDFRNKLSESILGPKSRSLKIPIGFGNLRIGENINKYSSQMMMDYKVLKQDVLEYYSTFNGQLGAFCKNDKIIMIYSITGSTAFEAQVTMEHYEKVLGQCDNQQKGVKHWIELDKVFSVEYNNLRKVIIRVLVHPEAHHYFIDGVDLW